MDKTLTDKQARFCEEYLIDLNATQAAIRAGYSSDTAHSIGHENLSKPEIADHIAALQAKRSETTQINAAWLLQRLADEATADINDLYSPEGDLLPVSEWPKIWRVGLIQGIDVEELFEGRGENREHVGRVRKIKISDRVKRLELIGRHIGVQAFKDQMGLGGPNGGPVEVNVSDARSRILGRLDSLSPPEPATDEADKRD